MESHRYVEDIYPSELLYARTLRSPIARGRLISIECPPLSDGYTLITADDIPGINQLENLNYQTSVKDGSPIPEIPVLAKEKLSYIGEPLALLLGPDPGKLEDYAEKCVINTEEETPVFSNSLIFDDMILAERSIRKGNTDEIFRRNMTTILCTYRTGIQEHWYSEPIGAVASFEAEERHEADDKQKKRRKTLLVRTATQWPFHVRLSISRLLKLDLRNIRVEPTIIDLHMDGKLWYPSLVSCHAALCAWISQKPVRLILSKEEDFRWTLKRCETEICINTALDESGRILGNDIELTVNMGANVNNIREILDQSSLACLGIYRMDNIQLSGKAIRTNIPPQGPFSGFGLAQGFFAIERHVSFLADIFNKNPAQWRKEQCMQYNSLPSGLFINEIPPIEKLIDTCAAKSDYNRKWASYELIRRSRKQSKWVIERGENLHGIGIALGWQGSGFIYRFADKSNTGITLTFEKDGSLEIITSAYTYEEDFICIWKKIASEILAIDIDKITVNFHPDAPDSGPDCASRNIAILTKLIERCCMDIRKQRFRDPLPITVTRFMKPQKNSQWKEYLSPEGEKGFDASGFINPSWAAAVVEIEIDPIEYIPKVRGIWLSIDGGKIILKDRAERSLKTASIQALGWASLEQLRYTNGMLSREQFDSYNILSPMEIPPVEIYFLQNNSEISKGIGELPFTCIPAAYVQAVSQAMDHHFQSIPLCPSEIWEAGRQKMEDGIL